MPDDLRLGKAGLTPGFVSSARLLLARKELVKLRFTELEGLQRRQLAQEVAQALDATCVALVGRTLLLYQPHQELDPKDRALSSP